MGSVVTGTSNMKSEDCACDIKSEHLPLASLVVKSRSGDVASCNNIACNADDVMAHTWEITQGIPRLSPYHSDTNNHGSYGIVVEKSEIQPAEINKVFPEENSAVFIKLERSPETQGDITYPKPSSVRNADHSYEGPPTNDFVKQEFVEDDKTILLAYYLHEQGNNNFVSACCEDANTPAATYPTNHQIQNGMPNQSSNICKCSLPVGRDYNVKLFEIDGTDPFKTEATKSTKDAENGSATWDNGKGDIVGEIKSELPVGKWRDVMDSDEGFEERGVYSQFSNLVNEQVYDPITDHVSSTVRATNPASCPLNQVYDPITDHCSDTARPSDSVSSRVSVQVNDAFTDHVSSTARDIQTEVSAGLCTGDVRVKGVRDFNACVGNSSFQPDRLAYNMSMSPTSGLQTELCRTGQDKNLSNKAPKERKNKRTHTGEKPHTCGICSKTFTQMSNLTTHTRTHTGEKPYTCGICSKTFTRVDALTRHKRTHTGEKPYTCNICSKAFTHLNSLTTHKRIHTGEKPYTCNICSKTFACMSHLRTHALAHTGEKPYTCNICSKAFTRVNSLKVHKRIHTGEKPYTCNICSKTFTCLSHLRSHTRTHTGEKPYTCNICSKAFTHVNSLTIHKCRHTGEKPYTCNICSKTFTCLSHLRSHTRTHTGEKPYTCNICSKAFTHVNSLAIHKRIHTGEKPYTCNICSKTFACMSHLRTHTRTHTGEKPYTCSICSKAFTYVNNLTTHKLTHTGERPYTCNICSKAFAQVSRLRAHKRTHTGEKPYTCNTCYKTFTRVDNLNRHKRTHTGEKLLNM